MRLQVLHKCASAQDRMCGQGDCYQQRKDGCEGTEFTAHPTRWMNVGAGLE